MNTLSKTLENNENIKKQLSKIEILENGGIKYGSKMTVRKVKNNNSVFDEGTNVYKIKLYLTEKSVTANNILFIDFYSRVSLKFETINYILANYKKFEQYFNFNNEIKQFESKNEEIKSAGHKLYRVKVSEISPLTFESALIKTIKEQAEDYKANNSNNIF